MGPPAAWAGSPELAYVLVRPCCPSEGPGPKPEAGESKSRRSRESAIGRRELSAEAIGWGLFLLSIVDGVPRRRGGGGGGAGAAAALLLRPWDVGVGVVGRDSCARLGSASSDLVLDSWFMEGVEDRGVDCPLPLGVGFRATGGGGGFFFSESSFITNSLVTGTAGELCRDVGLDGRGGGGFLEDDESPLCGVGLEDLEDSVELTTSGSSDRSMRSPISGPSLFVVLGGNLGGKLGFWDSPGWC